MLLSVIIPCYNEADTLEEALARAQEASLPSGWKKELIVVNDGSTDRSAEILDRLSSTGDFTVIHRAKNGGKGAALKSGLARAKGEYVLIQDADLEYDPSDWQALLRPIIEGRCDSVFGSRTKKNNNVPYSAVYFYGGLLVTKVFNLLFGACFSDIATCYKLFPRSHIPALITSVNDDFVFDAVDLTAELFLHGSVVEVPISYRARTQKGGKKLNWRHGIEIVLAIVVARLGIAQHHHVGVRRVVRFLISGVSAALVNFFVLYVLTEFFGLWYLFSSAIAFITAFAVSFVMQKFWTFDSAETHKIKHQLPMHLSVAVVNLVLNLVIVYFLVEYVHLWYVLAQVVANIVLAVESFFAFRWIFR